MTKKKKDPSDETTRREDDLSLEELQATITEPKHPLGTLSSPLRQSRI